MFASDLPARKQAMQPLNGLCYYGAEAGSVPPVARLAIAGACASESYPDLDKRLLEAHDNHLAPSDLQDHTYIPEMLRILVSVSAVEPLELPGNSLGFGCGVVKMTPHHRSGRRCCFGIPAHSPTVLVSGPHEHQNLFFSYLVRCTEFSVCRGRITCKLAHPHMSMKSRFFPIIFI